MIYLNARFLTHASDTCAICFPTQENKCVACAASVPRQKTNFLSCVLGVGQGKIVSCVNIRSLCQNRIARGKLDMSEAKTPDVYTRDDVTSSTEERLLALKYGLLDHGAMKFYVVTMCPSSS